MATNGTFAPQEFKSSAEQSATAPSAESGGNAANSNLSKDEVAWFFVEQYYTTLSKSPEKLHLFYGKRSQFVYGLEAQVANVSVGRQAIQERISNLDFQDCKVRVSNVDSQASFDNIVIQVIGETSNKAGEPKKFVQTFVLAQQPSGYFVLNDILRYISEDGDEETGEAAAEPAVAEAEAAPAEVPAPAAAEPVEVEAQEAEPSALDPTAVEQKLQEVTIAGNDADANGSTAATTETTTSEAQEEPAAAADVESTARQIAEEDIKEAERPQDPSPTPVVKAAAQEPESAPAPIMPPKPMTWASRAAAAAGPRPVVPLPKTATPPAASQSRAPAPAAAATAAPAQPAAAPAAAAAATPTATATSEAPAKEASGWQMAGADSKRQNRPQSISQAPTEKEGTMGYVKYVTDKVQEAELRAALAAHGELTYFDINRQKNCAFVEYKTVEGYQAAVSANPHVVNGENIVVEPRRPKSTAYGGSNYGSGRGGVSGGRGRGGFDGNRPGGQGNARGNFSGQNRGRGGMPRGRGGPQATNA